LADLTTARHAAGKQAAHLQGDAGGRFVGVCTAIAADRAFKLTIRTRDSDHSVGRLHCIHWEATTGLRWAELLAMLRATGRSMPIKDSLLAATALVHDLAVVTRNVGDFAKANVRVVDPFALASS
jgi:hypothetical protein